MLNPKASDSAVAVRKSKTVGSVGMREKRWVEIEP
jgi:hypothetical protein